MRLKRLVLILAALVMAGVLGSALGACNFLGGGEQSSQPSQPAVGEQGSEGNEPGGPADKTLRLTVPKMERIQDDVIPTGVGTDEQLFHDYAAVHLEGTGFPWEEEANVYIAGHRLGFPNTDSYLAFYDIENLQNGDEVMLTDADGNEYRYEVFETLVVSPYDLYVLDPLPGRNIVTLQSCTLPDYTERVIVRAELVA